MVESPTPATRRSASRRARRLAQATGYIVRALSSASYRHRGNVKEKIDSNKDEFETELQSLLSAPTSSRPYFEVLIVDRIPADKCHELRDGLVAKQGPDDPFSYDIFVVPSFEDALIATVLNPQIQAVVIGPDFRMRSLISLDLQAGVLDQVDDLEHGDTLPSEAMGELARLIGEQRPEIDVYLVSDASVEGIVVPGEEVDDPRRPNDLGILIVQRQAVFGALEGLSKRFFPGAAPSVKSLHQI